METQREEVRLHFLCISVVHLKFPTFRLTTALQRCKLFCHSTQLRGDRRRGVARLFPFHQFLHPFIGLTVVWKSDIGVVGADASVRHLPNERSVKRVDVGDAKPPVLFLRGMHGLVGDRQNLDIKLIHYAHIIPNPHPSRQGECAEKLVQRLS